MRVLQTVLSLYFFIKFLGSLVVSFYRFVNIVSLFPIVVGCMCHFIKYASNVSLNYPFFVNDIFKFLAYHAKTNNHCHPFWLEAAISIVKSNLAKSNESFWNNINLTKYAMCWWLIDFMVTNIHNDQQKRIKCQLQKKATSQFWYRIIGVLIIYYKHLARVLIMTLYLYCWYCRCHFFFIHEHCARLKNVSHGISRVNRM